MKGVGGCAVAWLGAELQCSAMRCKSPSGKRGQLGGDDGGPAVMKEQHHLYCNLLCVCVSACFWAMVIIHFVEFHRDLCLAQVTL